MIEQKVLSVIASAFNCHTSAISYTQLAGNNNLNYKATLLGQDYFVKFAAQNGKVPGVSLENDIACRTSAFHAGLTPKIMLYDAQEAVMVTEFITTKGRLDFKQQDARQRYINLLRLLHKSNIIFPQKYYPCQIIRQFVQTAQELGTVVPDIVLETILPKIYSLEAENLFLESVPCHLDPNLDNVLDTGEKLYFIDWEFAGMCDPFFDLAWVCTVDEFSDDLMFELLALYLNRQPTESEKLRLGNMRLITDMRGCGFCYIHMALTPSRKDFFQAYTERLIGHMLKRLENEQY